MANEVNLKAALLIVIKLENVYKNPLFLVGNCEVSISMIVRNSSIWGGTD